MKVNYKQLYTGLKQQAKVLQNELTPNVNDEKVNEIPENFNQIGWNVTIEKIELMVEKMKKLREIKGNRLTPQFYRSIYNRALIASNEADKLIEILTTETAEIDYESEVKKLNNEIFQLQLQISESNKAKELAEQTPEQTPEQVSEQNPEAKPNQNNRR